MTTADILKKLESLGSDQIKKIFIRHGAREPFYGVKVQDLKKIVQEVKKEKTAKDGKNDPGAHRHQLALELYSSGISDAMYLAGLLADPGRMDSETLQKWVDGAYWYMLSDYTVAWVAAESPFGWNLGLEWIRSERELTASSGWCTLGGIVSMVPDDKLDIPKLQELIELIGRTLISSPNRVRYSMNSFLIAASSYVPQLTSQGKSTAFSIGKISVDMGGTACKVPFALDYINKIEQMGRIGQKRKSVVC